MTHPLKVLVVSGASGGHLFPAQALLDALKDGGDVESLLVLPRKNILKDRKALAHRLEYISVSSIGLGPSFKNLFAFFNFFRGTIESAAIIFKFRPDVVAGFGSIVSVPVILIARLLGAKTLIHEQNLSPGRATGFLCGFVDRIAVSFAETEEYLKKYRSKIILTGNPLRSELAVIEKQKALEFFGLQQDKFTILVCGGSQGSSSLNAAFQGALASLPERSGIQVIHLSGKKELPQVEKRYKELGVSARCLDFLDKMQYAYSCSDLAVSRSGATTIAELVFFRLPSILIPYPYAYRHQSLNAEALEKSGSAVIVDDHELDKGGLKMELARLLGSRDEVAVMRQSCASLPQGGSRRIIKRGSFISCREKG